MLIDFTKETLSLYTSSEDYFPVLVTRVVDYKEAEEGKPDFYLIGVRTDLPQQVITILHPFRNEIPVEPGDYILVKRLSAGYSIFVAKLSKKFDEENRENEKFIFKPTIPQFSDKKSFGQSYNSSLINLTYTGSYLKKEPDALYKRFVEFPSYDLYRSSYDVFNYDEKFWEILNDKNEDEISRKYIFHLSENPTYKDYLLDRNKDDNFPFRPDVVFDFTHEYSPKNKQDKLLKLDKKITLFTEENTDKYPFLQAEEEIDENLILTSYDEILNKKAEGYLGEDIFYAQEFREIKLGRNKIGLYKINKNDSFLLLKTSKDQQFSAINFGNKSQLRIRNDDGSSILLEKHEDFNRTFISAYPSLLFEQFYKENYQHVLILNAEKEAFKNLQKSSSSLNDYSFGLFLRGSKDASLKRTYFTYNNALSDSQSVILGTKKQSSFSYITLSSDTSKSVFNTHIENVTYVDILADSSSGCFKVENNKNGVKKFTFCEDKFVIEDYLTVHKDLLVNRNTQLQGNLNVLGTTSLTTTYVNGILTVNGPVIASAFIISGGGGGGGGGGGSSGGSDYTTNPNLNALSTLDGSGYIVQNGQGTFFHRSIQPGSSKVIIQNGDGVSGNTSIDIDESQLSIQDTQIVGTGQLVQNFNAALLNGFSSDAFAKLSSNETISGTWTFNNVILGTIQNAQKLANSRQISLTGDVTGSTSFDGSQDVQINAVIADNSITTNKLADNSVTVQKISAANQPSANTYLRGDGTWSELPIKEYVFYKNSPAMQWIINHGLGYKPNVAVYTTGGVEIEAEVIHTNNNQVVINFTLPTAGFARLL